MTIQNSQKLTLAIIMGLLFIALGLTWLFVYGIPIGQLFFIPFVLIIFGVILVIRGFIQKTGTPSKPDTSAVIDQNGDLDS